MDINTALLVLRGVIDSLEDMVVVFEAEKPIVINRAFGKFFGVSSAEEYNEGFGAFINNFVPHPSYFHAQKIQSGLNWMDAVMELDEIDRVVSMITQTHEPRAFSVDIKKVEGYSIVFFSDITATLIKRIMKQNNTSIDSKSGAYAKNYFMHVAQSFQDAAEVNEKTICAILIKATKKDGSEVSDDGTLLKDIAAYFKASIRQDDMLVRWSTGSFVVVFLAENAENADAMLKKLSQYRSDETIKDTAFGFSLYIKKESQTLGSFINSWGLDK